MSKWFADWHEDADRVDWVRDWVRVNDEAAAWYDQAWFEEVPLNRKQAFREVFGLSLCLKLVREILQRPADLVMLQLRRHQR